MFDLFGNMDSAEEINKTAEGLKAEGDIENLKKLAEENGIPVEMAELYASGEIEELTDTMMAAVGKIETEERDLKPAEIMKDWTEYLKSQCMDNEKLAAAIRRKDKSLKGCMGALLRWSYKNMLDVDKDIQKAAGFSGKVELGIPGMGRAKTIIREYYLTDEKKEAKADEKENA